VLRPSKRLVVVILVAACAAVAARIAAPSYSHHFRFSPALACGVERWKVKTLQDRPRLLPLRDTTIAYLVGRPRPASLPATRLPFERHIFRVRATVTLVRPESDSDLHLVIQSGTSHMIAEAPSRSCTMGATRTRRSQMNQARGAVRLCTNAVVTGSRSSTSSTARAESRRTRLSFTRSPGFVASRPHPRLHRRLRHRARIAPRRIRMSAFPRRRLTSTARTFPTGTSGCCGTCPTQIRTTSTATRTGSAARARGRPLKRSL
jgi:hypothetical protein